MKDEDGDSVLTTTKVESNQILYNLYKYTTNNSEARFRVSIYTYQFRQTR